MDYVKLWFALWGILWAGYFALDGFDLGVGMVSRAVARTEEEKNAVFASIVPFWDGNEVWLVAAGGVTFAAFPGAYAAMFSWFYSAMFLALFGLILRGVSLEFMRKAGGGRMRNLLEAGFIFGSILPVLVFGLAFGNIFRGLSSGASGYEGGLAGLLNPFSFLFAALFAALFAFHGSLWLSCKTRGVPAERASNSAKKLWGAAALLLALTFVYSVFDTALAVNYLGRKYLFAAPLFCAGSLAAARFFAARRPAAAFMCSMSAVASLLVSGFIGIYPELLPSRLDPAYSVTIFNSASGPYTLKVMAAAAAVFLPLIIAYQFWVYRLFKTPLSAEELKKSGIY